MTQIYRTHAAVAVVAILLAALFNSTNALPTTGEADGSVMLIKRIPPSDTSASAPPSGPPSYTSGNPPSYHTNPPSGGGGSGGGPSRGSGGGRSSTTSGGGGGAAKRTNSWGKLDRETKQVMYPFAPGGKYDGTDKTKGSSSGGSSRTSGS